MEVRKRAIRIGALGSMLFTTSALVFGGTAGAAPAEKDHKGHVHFDKKLKNGKGGADDVRLDRLCSIAIRPHKFETSDVSFSLTAQGKKPTATSELIPVAVGDDLFKTTTNPSWSGTDITIIHLDAIKDMADPHGKIEYDKDGSIKKNNLHWHVKLQVTDTVNNKKFKKDVKVYNCDPKLPPVTPPKCLDGSKLFGAVLGVEPNGQAQAGTPAVGITYIGSKPLNADTLDVEIDGVDADTVINGSDIWAMLPVPLASGDHKAEFSIEDEDEEVDACAATSFIFKTNQGQAT